MKLEMTHITSCRIVLSIEHGEVLSVTGPAEFYGACLTSCKEGICSETVRNVGTGSTVFATTKGTSRKLGIVRIGGDFSCN